MSSTGLEDLRRTRDRGEYADVPLEYRSCPACGDVYGRYNRKVCIECEECSACCTCAEPDRRPWREALDNMLI